MEQDALVLQPMENEILPAPTFLAFGFAKGVRRIFGDLLDADLKIVSEGVTLMGPPDFLIEFRDVPAGGPYTLIVAEPGGFPLDWVRGLTMPEAFPEAVGITYPTTGSTVPKTFIAYGTTNEPGGMTGVMDNGVNVVLGAVLNVGPPSWAIRFNNVPAGNNYTLTVTKTGSGTSISSNNLTVSC